MRLILYNQSVPNKSRIFFLFFILLGVWEIGPSISIMSEFQYFYSQLYPLGFRFLANHRYYKRWFSGATIIGHAVVVAVTYPLIWV